MCGFAGAFSHPESGPVELARIKRMGELIAHRGPDDSHTESINASLAISFRRLSIIDLSENGRQPMWNSDRTACVAFNGEIYNFRQLRDSDVSDYPYRSDSDTEVILALYKKYGIDFVGKLNGMFSIALWDERLQRLFLISDRFGIKPLYFSQTKRGEVVFASEIKSLLAYTDQPKKLDANAVLDYLSFQFGLNDQTIYSGVKTVAPGTWLSFDCRNPKLEPTQTTYWTGVPPKTLRSDSITSIGKDLQLAIQNAISRQTRSDVPVGSFLSSGMDSSSICAIASRSLPHLDTFTCGFDTQSMTGDIKFVDERREAREYATIIGSTHHELVLNSASLRTATDKAMYHIEDPKVGISYQILEMAQLVRKNVTVVLSGTGGDELFGGYNWRYDSILGVSDHDQFLNNYFRQWNRILTPSEMKTYFKSSVLSDLDIDGPRKRFDSVFESVRDLDPLSKALYFDSKTFLRGLLLVDDKLSMAHSIETRVPLLDNEVVDLALQIPSELKYDGKVTKRVLKEALKNHLPDEVLHRRKQGFTPPDDVWFRTDNRQWIATRLLSEQFLEQGWFKREGIESILELHNSGKKPCRFLIWALLCLDSVNRQFLNNTSN